MVLALGAERGASDAFCRVMRWIAACNCQKKKKRGPCDGSQNFPTVVFDHDGFSPFRKSGRRGKRPLFDLLSVTLGAFFRKCQNLVEHRSVVGRTVVFLPGLVFWRGVLKKTRISSNAR